METSDMSSYGTTLLPESIKVIAEGVGICNLSDDSANDLAEDISCKLKIILQDAMKFMEHGKRRMLTTRDVDYALKTKNVEPLLGYHGGGEMPFRFVSGGGRELHVVEERQIDLSEMIAAAKDGNGPKLPLETNLRAHWLAIDGVQPSVPENSTPVSKEAQKQKTVNPPTIKISCSKIGKPRLKKQKLRNTEIVLVKELTSHELSIEQQIYYQVITEACVGPVEAERAQALTTITTDPGLPEMLPRLCTFVTEGVRINVDQGNLAILIYLMRMVKAIVENPALYLKKYLHELIPAIVTCAVAKRLCSRPELDNHWALRDFSSRLNSQLCKEYDNITNCIQTRVISIFEEGLTNIDKLPLTSLYGTINGLCELGAQVIEALLIPKMKLLSKRLEACLESPDTSNVDKNSAGHIKTLIIKSVAPILKNLRPGPDLLENYKEEYGYLGAPLCTAVAKQRNLPKPAQWKAITSVRS